MGNRGTALKTAPPTESGGFGKHGRDTILVPFFSFQVCVGRCGVCVCAFVWKRGDDKYFERKDQERAKAGGVRFRRMERNCIKRGGGGKQRGGTTPSMWVRLQAN